LKTAFNNLLVHAGLIRSARRIWRHFNPAWRESQAGLARVYSEFLDHRDASVFGAAVRDDAKGVALIVGYDSPKSVLLQIPIILALKQAGFRVVVLAPSAIGASGQFYRQIGADDVIGVEDVERPIRQRTIDEMLRGVTTQEQLVGLAYEGTPCGKFITSTLMRRSRQGSIDPTDPKISNLLRAATEASLRAVAVARRVVERVRPTLVCFYDRGYTPDGELFEVALASGAHAVTVNAAHRGGLIMCKRYGPENRDRHFAAPSAALWKQLSAMPWDDGRWQELRSEIEESYRSGSWYDEVGTQFNKKMRDRNDIFTSLGLDPNKKVAVIFPHLFWDATFFWGEDIFSDYKDWFCQTIKAAAANDRLNWIIKIHPASLTKDVRDGYRGESSEVIAIRETLGSLPEHIKLIAPDSESSTFSLFDVMDYCLTVRGTIGIEAAAFGVSVLTAGTGRYDRYGFTIDSRSREEYLDRLAKLEDVPRPTRSQIDPARRYAYGLFLLRPLKLDSVRFQYLRDASASLQVVFGLKDGHQLATCPDLKVLASWLAATGEEDLVGRAISVHAESAYA
jgi:hypothetical protein